MSANCRRKTGQQRGKLSPGGNVREAMSSIPQIRLFVRLKDDFQG